MATSPLNTLHSLYSRHHRDLKLLSLLARVRNSGSLLRSNICNSFLAEISYSLYGVVRHNGVSLRRELTVLGILLAREKILLNGRELQDKRFPTLSSRGSTYTRCPKSSFLYFFSTNSTRMLSLTKLASQIKGA